jgi:hypothetical protein
MKITFVIKDVLCISYHHEVDVTSTVEKYISNDKSVKNGSITTTMDLIVQKICGIIVFLTNIHEK